MSPRSLSSTSRSRCQELAGFSRRPAWDPLRAAPARSTPERVRNGSTRWWRRGRDRRRWADRPPPAAPPTTSGCPDRRSGSDSPDPAGTCLDPCAAPGICRDRPGHCAHRRLHASGTAGHDLGGEALRHTDLPAPTLIDLHTAPSYATGSIRRGRDTVSAPTSRSDAVAIMPDRRSPPITAGHRPTPHVLLERPAGRRRADPLAVGQRVAANPAAPGAVWYRGAPVASAARECHVTIPRNVDRVRNPAGVEGLAARPLRWSVTRASGSVARPLAVSRRSVSGCRSTARGAGKGRNAADGPGRRAIVPTAPQRGDRARLPLSSVQHVGGGK